MRTQHDKEIQARASFAYYWLLNRWYGATLDHEAFISVDKADPQLRFTTAYLMGYGSTTVERALKDGQI
uniref:Uncharacterized protein n=1 Tax=viral metagenome TaxID=1070528 RepID=A0A6H1ZF87_9ZZZZ